MDANYAAPLFGQFAAGQQPMQPQWGNQGGSSPANNQGGSAPANPASTPMPAGGSVPDFMQQLRAFLAAPTSPSLSTSPSPTPVQGNGAFGGAAPAIGPTQPPNNNNGTLLALPQGGGSTLPNTNVTGVGNPNPPSVVGNMTQLGGGRSLGLNFAG